MKNGRNFALLFIKDGKNKNLYNFNSVVQIENNKIVSNSVHNGKSLDKHLFFRLNFESFISNADNLNRQFEIIPRNIEEVITTNAFDNLNYIVISITDEEYEMLKANALYEHPNFTEEEAHIKVCTWLYKIGDILKNIERKQFFFFTSNKSYPENVKNRSRETIINSCTVLKKEMTQNKEAEEKEKSNTKQNTTIKKLDISELNPDDIIKKLKEKIIGQDYAITDVVDTLFMNQMVINSGDEDDITVAKSNILIDGPTGTGKTMIVKELSKNLSLPMVIASVTSFSTTGYKGADLEDILVKLLDAAGGNIELAQRGIICLDEFDKLGAKDEHDNLIMKKALQQELLSYLSGGKFDIEYGGKTIEFDTSKVTFIALGAFTNLRERKIKENEKKFKESKIGFASVDKKEYDKTYSISTQDYIDEGINREFIGRFTTQTYTRALTIEDYKKILTDSLTSPLRTLRKIIESYGKKLVYDEEVIDYIANIVNSNNTGARGLQTIFNPISRALMREIRDNNTKEIHLTIELIDKLQHQNIRRY